MELLQFSLGLLCVAPIFGNRIIGDQGSDKLACYTPLGERGLCVSLKNCPYVVNLFTTLPKPKATQYAMVLQNICGRQITKDNYPVVCCTLVVPDRVNATELNTTSAAVRGDVTSKETVTSSPPLSTNRPTVTLPDFAKAPECRAPQVENGVCLPLQNCSKLLASIRNDPTNETLKEYLRSSNKICGSAGTEVCCPSEKTQELPHLPTEEEGCGLVTKNSLKVVGGEDSEIGAWPWIALIGYQRYSLNPFKCGGTLLTARCVLTAAHCILRDLSFVRLGEYDLSTETETNHVDINVKTAMAHPDFSRDKRNDIAVLYLENNVEFSELISPICMPISNELRVKSYVGWNPFVAGWGRTTEGGVGATILQQLQVPVRNNSECRRVFDAHGKLLSNEQFDESVLCAGGIGGRDSCRGDSGGPLMIPEPYKGITRYYLIGVVSYGIGCGKLGVPGVYASTQYFMDWIVARIAES